VEDGGTLVATHLTSVADELGRPRSNYGLADLLGASFDSPEPVEIPDLYLRILPSRRLLLQDPQVMTFHAAPGAEVLAETYDRGHRRTLGPAIISRGHGKGRVIYIGSGLEAIYQETLNQDLRAHFHALLDPILGAARTYDVDYRPGLSTQLVSSPDVLLLHMFANTGNICKKLLVQESYLPVASVRARLRIPQGRTVKSVSLLWSGAIPASKVTNGWVEVTIPQVHPYELVRVDLRS
jgi:hypothetical protein